MAIKVIEKNVGTKIDWRQDGTKLIFGDDDLTINCATRQKDWPVHTDICMDSDGNLVIGFGIGRYYVAQIDIPAIEYLELPNLDSDTEEISRKPLSLNMNDVTLTLWEIKSFGV